MATELCLDERVHLTFKEHGRRNTVTVYQDGKIFYSATYLSYRYDRINMLDPDFNKYREEDQDIFLFIYNVMNDSGRRKGIYTSGPD